MKENKNIGNVDEEKVKMEKNNKAQANMITYTVI